MRKKSLLYLPQNDSNEFLVTIGFQSEINHHVQGMLWGFLYQIRFQLIKLFKKMIRQ